MMASPAPGLRLFVAAEVTEAVRAACGSVRDRFGAALRGARWTRPEGVHLTLKFLGSVPEARVAAIGEVMAACAAVSRAFTVTTGGSGTFGGARRPRVLWVAIEGDMSSAGDLARRHEDGFETLGFARESRPFRLHLTLARLDERTGGPIPEPLLEAVSTSLSGLRIPVDDIVLFHSRPGPGGSSYTPLRREPLQGAPTA